MLCGTFVVYESCFVFMFPFFTNMIYRALEATKI